LFPVQPPSVVYNSADEQNRSRDKDKPQVIKIRDKAYKSKKSDYKYYHSSHSGYRFSMDFSVIRPVDNIKTFQIADNIGKREYGEDKADEENQDINHFCKIPPDFL